MVCFSDVGCTLVICYIAIAHGPVEIVDLPTKNGDFSTVNYVNVYQRVDGSG